MSVILMRLSRQGADLNCIDCKGNSPLLLATSCSAWRTVTLLLSKGELRPFASRQQYTNYQGKRVHNAVGSHSRLCFCYLGANVNEKDRCGCNFLHLAILQPKGLKNLPEEVLQVPTSQCFLFTGHQTRCSLPRHRCL